MGSDVLHFADETPGIHLPTARTHRKCKKYGEERGWNRILGPVRAAFPFTCGHSWDEGTTRLLWYIDVSTFPGDVKGRVWTENLEGFANDGVASAKD